jgi:uncharacterized protein (TIGR03435 family)
VPHIRAAAGLFAITLVQAHGQAQPAFEVASVRLNRTELRGGSMDFSTGGERFSMRNMPLGALILVAYNVTARQLSGTSEFLSRKYDITAKAEHPVKKDEMLRMLQALLADRFKLIVRRETREVPVYALTIGKSGPNLKTSELPDSDTPRTPAQAGGTEPDRGHLIFANESMPDLAWALSRTGGIDRLVVDATGLNGRYDFELKFGRETAPQTAVPPAEAGLNVENPSIFAALPEQLGLKLESRKAPVDFLVIEHIEKPSEN